ncbi:MAG: hypothetical protein IPJ85_10935 [Flavobacteriales bacterium]|nr:hypothetical protein [Flavobacteriales bacterium]
MMLARCLSTTLMAIPMVIWAQFSAPSVLLTEDSADPLTAIDLDGDGDLDLVRPHAQFGLIAYTNVDGQGNYAFGGTILPASLELGSGPLAMPMTMASPMRWPNSAAATSCIWC